MKSHLGTFAAAVLVLTASAGCAHRTTTVHRTSETVRTDTGSQAVAPPPVVEDSTTVIKRSHSSTQEGQQ
jgi:hypothetical protein